MNTETKIEPYWQMDGATVYWGDCLEVMDAIPDGSVDAVIADLPYGTTQCKWDSVVPLDALWRHYKRIIKPGGAVALNAAQPFTSSLVMSNPDWFRFDDVWDKVGTTGFLDAKRRPLRRHESVLIFSGARHTYNPQMRTGRMRKKGGRRDKEDQVYGKCAGGTVENDQYYPTSIIEASNAGAKAYRLHPTQKPVALMEYLIRTYTNENETVLDNTMGSGTTGVACAIANRKFIGIEKEQAYCDIAIARIGGELARKRLEQGATK